MPSTRKGMLEMEEAESLCKSVQEGGERRPKRTAVPEKTGRMSKYEWQLDWEHELMRDPPTTEGMNDERVFMIFCIESEVTKEHLHPGAV